MINKLILIGRLAKNPEVNYVPKQNKYVVNVCIVQNIKNKDGAIETYYFNCSCWNESIIKKLRNDNFVGLQVAVEAKIFIKNVKGKDDKWATKTTILIDNLDLI